MKGSRPYGVLSAFGPGQLDGQEPSYVDQDGDAVLIHMYVGSSGFGPAVELLVDTTSERETVERLLKKLVADVSDHFDHFKAGFRGPKIEVDRFRGPHDKRDSPYVSVSGNFLLLSLTYGDEGELKGLLAIDPSLGRDGARRLLDEAKPELHKAWDAHDEANVKADGSALPIRPKSKVRDE